jgi:FkbM family methyltransferase
MNYIIKKLINKIIFYKDFIAKLLIINSLFFRYKIIRIVIYYLLSNIYIIKDLNRLKFILNKKKIKLTENSLIIDIGANVGITSIFFYDNYKSNILSYEPNPVCYKFFKENIRIKKIKIYKQAVSNANKYSKLYLANYQSGNNLLYSGSSSLDKKKNNIDKLQFLKVKTKSISNIINKFKRIDLIKINIEGEEYKILPYLLNNISKIGIIFCELHENKKKKTLIKFLKHKKLLNNKFYLW